MEMTNREFMARRILVGDFLLGLVLWSLMLASVQGWEAPGPLVIGTIGLALAVGVPRRFAEIGVPLWHPQIVHIANLKPERPIVWLRYAWLGGALAAIPLAVLR
jgi:hypothetical protein